MLISILIPTYRRPSDLLRCLKALEVQTRKVDQLVVTVRDIDGETWEALKTIDCTQIPLQIVKVAVPGVVAAMNAGLEVLSGDIVAITDDDSVPHPDWVERIEQHFLMDEQIGGVGGRDYVYHGEFLEDGAAQTVGKISWFGRTTGNHHIGIGEAREVDILKGVNMSFRKTAINKLRFDERMKGTGAQVHFELAFCLTLKKTGWKLIYDPKIAVNHYPAPRYDEDQRQWFNAEAYANAVFNETLILLEYLSTLQRVVFMLWACLIGTRQSFGLLQVVRFYTTEEDIAFQKLCSSLQGRWHAWRIWQKFISTASISN